MLPSRRTSFFFSLLQHSPQFHLLSLLPAARRQLFPFFGCSDSSLTFRTTAASFPSLGPCIKPVRCRLCYPWRHARKQSILGTPKPGFFFRSPQITFQCLLVEDIGAFLRCPKRLPAFSKPSGVTRMAPDLAQNQPVQVKRLGLTSVNTSMRCSEHPHSLHPLGIPPAFPPPPLDSASKFEFLPSSFRSNTSDPPSFLIAVPLPLFRHDMKAAYLRCRVF